MRVTFFMLLLLSLTACQTTTKSSPSAPATTAINSTGRHIEEIDLFDVASELTYNSETTHALTSGTFTEFEPTTLDQLKATSTRFDRPGLSLLYLKFLREIQDDQAKKNIKTKYEALKNEAGIARQHRAFFKKVHDRIVAITLAEEEAASLCMAKYTWSYLPDNQRITFDKMATGATITSEEIEALKITATGRSNEIIPVKCVLEPMELYGRYKKLFSY
ncbi:hypothetical protein [Kiloniella antarctica]|uniref:Lipoprotein n=1 Tax=Kiloniella antarctica TaxID=1550907 RepID=A0ABW5BHC9_9PROT